MPDEEKLKLGKGAAFVKSRLKQLPQGDDTWEADFRALPKPITQSVTHYQGMVVSQADGSLLAVRPIHSRPTVNDLATLLAYAMRRPLDGDAHRPRLVRLRGHHQWRELFLHLKEIGIGVEISVERGLPMIEEVYDEYLRQMRDIRRTGMVKPSPEQAKSEATLPAIARWVKEDGWIEIGVQEPFGFIARALHEGGTKFEDDRPDTLAEALAALEAGLIAYYERETGKR